MCQQGDGRYSVQGVTSWGQGCGLPNFPGVYARVASSLAWIEDVLEGKVKPKAVAHEERLGEDFQQSRIHPTHDDISIMYLYIIIYIYLYIYICIIYIYMYNNLIMICNARKWNFEMRFEYV